MAEVTVTVEQGKLKGKTDIDSAGNVYYSFQGIPFAKPPVGKLRFRVIITVISHVNMSATLIPLRILNQRNLGRESEMQLKRVRLAIKATCYKT